MDVRLRIRAIGVLVTTFCLACVSCMPSDPSSEKVYTQSQGVGAQPLASQIAVVDPAGHAISSATVLFGRSAGAPFSANVLKTDTNGIANWPPAWKQALPVTVDAPGFVRATFLDRLPGPHTFVLRPARSVAPISLVGKTTGFGRLVSNGVLDVSLVFPAVPRASFGALELTALIGNGVDKVSVYGQELELPVNLSVPAQTETYFGFIPVSLDKLKYQVSVPTKGTYRLAAVRAQFDFKKTVDDLRAGSSFFDIINRFQFRSYASRDLNLGLPLQVADLPTDEVKLQPKLSVKAAGLPSGYALLATFAMENQGLCVVTDVKRLLESEQRNLMIPDLARANLGSGILLQSIKKYQPSRTDFSGPDFEEMSSVISKVTSAGSLAQPAVGFYPVLKAIATTGRSLILAPPGPNPGLINEKTSVTLSAVSLVSSGTLWLVDKTPIWDFYGAGQVAVLDIPSLGGDPWSSKGRYRWELLYTGQQAGTGVASATSLGPMDGAAATHFVKTATDFQVP